MAGGKKNIIDAVATSGHSTKPNVRCSALKLWKVCHNLNDDQRKIVRDMGFGGLLSCPKIEYNHDLIHALAKRLDTHKFCLNVGAGTIPVTREQVGEVLGLTTSGQPFHDISTIANDVTDEFKGITLSNLQTMLADNTLCGDRFKRAFIMFALKAFLTPKQNTQATKHCLIPIIDVADPTIYDWGKLVHEGIYDGVKDYLGNDSKGINGCVHVLQVLYFHRDRYGRLDNQYKGPPRPWIQYWQYNEVTAFLMSEKKSATGLIKPIPRMKRKRDTPAPNIELPTPSDEGTLVEVMVKVKERRTKKKHDILEIAAALEKLKHFAPPVTSAQSVEEEDDAKIAIEHKATPNVNMINALLVAVQTQYWTNSTPTSSSSRP